MANTNNTTNTHYASHSLPAETQLSYFPFADAIRHLDCSQLTIDESLAISFGCEDALLGLCHTLHFMGENLTSLASDNREQLSRKVLVS